MGLFGTSAELITDINLIVQMISLALIIIGSFKVRPFKEHGIIMLVVTLIAVISTVTFMAPSLIMYWMLYSPTIYLHAAAGSIAILIGALFNFKMVKAMRNSNPLICGTQKEMRIGIIIWLIPFIGGIFFYIMTYV